MKEMRYAYNAYSELVMFYCVFATGGLVCLIAAIHVFAGGSLNDPALLAALNPMMLTVWMLAVGWIVGLVWNIGREGWCDDDLGKTLGNALGQISFLLMLPGALTASLTNTAHLLG